VKIVFVEGPALSMWAHFITPIFEDASKGQ